MSRSLESKEYSYLPESSAGSYQNGLNTIWEQLPPEIQQEYPKEKVIKIKENLSRSPIVAKKISEAVTSLWHNNNEYRKKTLEGIRNRELPTQETIIRRGKTMQRIWNRKHGIEENADPLTRRGALFGEWLRITTQELDHSPSLHDIDRLRKENKTKFSATMYRQEFGEGSFTEAKQVLNGIVRTIAFLNELQEKPYSVVGRRVLEKDIKGVASAITKDVQDIFSSSSSANEIKKRATELEERLETFKNQLKARKVSHRIETQIGTEEMFIWQQIKDSNLLNEIIQTGQITQQELNMIRDYFEKNIIREGLNVPMFDRFTIGVARLTASKVIA